jgi:hypothetical protein
LWQKWLILSNISIIALFRGCRAPDTKDARLAIVMMRNIATAPRCRALHTGVVGDLDGAEALSWAEIAVREQPSLMFAFCVAAASGVLGGRFAEAQRAMARLRQLDSSLRVSNPKDFFPTRRAEDLARWEEGMRKAGLPE